MLTEKLKLFEELPLLERGRVLLRTAETANRTDLSRYPRTFETCARAIDECQDSLESESIQPEVLAKYVDENDADNPWMRESLFSEDKNGLHALIFITMVIAHFAHLSYLQQGRENAMSESIAEAGNDVWTPLLEYGERYGIYDFLKI